MNAEDVAGRCTLLRFVQFYPIWADLTTHHVNNITDWYQKNLNHVCGTKR
jgi:hypothetical protein